jgi:DNA-binding transcriptional MerR regulator
MRISDLSRQSGVPVATIKFYLRERLIPPGTPMARNQADYDQQHLRRLWLIRTFTGIGRLDLASTRDLLAAVDDDRVPLPDLYEVVNRALFPNVAESSDTEGVDRAAKDVDEFIAGLGWQLAPTSPGRSTLAHVMAALQRLGCDADVDFFTPFADAAARLAVEELDLLPDDPGETPRAVAVARSVLFDVALAALRRIAQEHHLAQRMRGARGRGAGWEPGDAAVAES